MAKSLDRVFAEAAYIIVKEGWTPVPLYGRSLRNERTLTEAVEYVVPWDGITPVAAFAELRRRCGMDPAAWNAADGRTVADVLALLAACVAATSQEAADAIDGVFGAVAQEREAK